MSSWTSPEAFGAPQQSNLRNLDLAWELVPLYAPEILRPKKSPFGPGGKPNGLGVQLYTAALCGLLLVVVIEGKWKLENGSVYRYVQHQLLGLLVPLEPHRTCRLRSGSQSPSA